MSKTNTAERLPSLDVLRGVAIVGTLLTNIWLFTSIGAWNSDTTEPAEGGNQCIVLISSALSNGKFLGLLSILFGVGMAIQFESALRNGHRWPWRYEWRSLLLLADGFVHFALVVDFDILMGYALVAMMVAPLMLLRTRWLVVAAMLAAALHLYMELRRYWSFSSGDFGSADAGATDTEPITDLPPSTYIGEVLGRLGSFWELRQEAFVIAPPLSAVLFLSGALLWRAGLFKGDERARMMSRRLALVGLGVGVPLTLWELLPLSLPGQDAVGAFSRYTIAPIMAFGYLGLILALLRWRGGTGFVARNFASVGRTALSCYMLQNVIALVAFSEWGLGMGPLGGLGTIVAWAAISAMLMLAASLWLRRFRQGPFELVWRAAVEAPFRRSDRKRPKETLVSTT